MSYSKIKKTQIHSYEGGANGVSLNGAKKNFAKYGAIKEELIKEEGTGRIPGPNSPDARVPGRNPADFEMPPATNIRIP